MRRTRTGKRIELTTRDIEIFKILEKYRYLRSTYIHAFVGGASATRFKERLGDLFHEGYLERPAEQWQFADACHRPAVYESGLGAEGILRESGIVMADARCFSSKAAHRQFLHSLMVCEVLASLDIGIRADPRLRFIAWPEILRRAPEATRSTPAPSRLPLPSGGYLVPDGLFGIEYAQGGAKAYRFFALEADRGTMPVARSSPNQTSYLGKLAAYREIIAREVHKTYLGVPNLLILTVTTSTPRVKEMIEKFDVQSDSGAGFLFRAAGASELSHPALHLLSGPWERAGFPALRIDG
jgi:hypothetical protein